jgi:tetratricopeptide (TPR) repeat protein
LTIRTNYIIFFFLVLFLSTSLGITALAQKKKKQPDGPVASPTTARQREAEFYFVEGEKYFILEDYAKALVYYQKTLEISPGNATVHYKIAQVMAQSQSQEDISKALSHAEQALQLEKKNKFFYLLAAGLYTHVGRFDKAAQTYESMLREVQGTDEYLYELALVYQYAAKPNDALQVYNKAEAVFGINEVSSLQKLRIYFEMGKNELAFQEGEKLLNAFPDEERYAVGLAETLSQAGFKERSIGYLEKFIRENKVAPNACMLLAGLYRDTNQEQRARDLLLSVFNDAEVEFTSKLIVLSTYNAELNHNKNNRQTDVDKEKFALELYTRLERDYPDEPNVLVIGGDLFLTLGRNVEAEKKYRQSIEAGVTSFEVWQNLLYLEMQLNQFEDVVKYSEQAMEYFPNQSMVYYFNGIANMRIRNSREAIRSLEQTKKLSASNPALVAEVNGLLGDAYNATKEFDKSDKAYEEALQFNPNNDVVLNNYSYYLSLRKTNLEKAEKMSAQLIKNNPDNATYLDTYAWVLYMRQKYKEAKKVMEKAIATGMANATHFEHYGDILFKLGDIDGAVQQWEKAKSLLNSNNEILLKKIANRKVYE